MGKPSNRPRAGEGHPNGPLSSVYFLPPRPVTGSPANCSAPCGTRGKHCRSISVTCTTRIFIPSVALRQGNAGRTGDELMRVAIVGCGFVGQTRARALAGCRLVACADAVQARAETLARMVPGAQPLSHWRDVVERQDVDIVIVSTTHDVLAEVALAAISAGKHVL